MTRSGTDLYEHWSREVPTLVRQAVEAARDLDFDLCVHPASGALLATLAGGLPPGSTVVETGTGTGAGLAWMVTAAHPDVRFLSVELDGDRAAAAAELFAGRPNVTTIHGRAEEHWYEHRPDLLVLDGGGGTGKKGDEPVDARRALAPRGTIVIDDFTPATSWPPTINGQVDDSRLHWLDHPDLHTTEVTVAPDMAVLVGRLLR
jgi:predicted O-methyltransferase YrrM